MTIQTVQHTISPIFDEQSRICILGTMPSPASREKGFYYGHPQNRFWRVLSAILNESIPIDNEAKKQMLLKHKIALWDVLSQCTIQGADDASIANPVPNDIAGLICQTHITHIFTTGTKAHKLYTSLCEQSTKLQAHLLPSTSPANCRFSLEDLIEAYSTILDYI